MALPKICEISYKPPSGAGRPKSGDYLSEKGAEWFERIISIAGGRKLLAVRLGCSYTFIGDMLLRRKPMSAKIINEIETMTRGFITRDFLFGEIAYDGEHYKTFLLLKQVMELNVTRDFRPKTIDEYLDLMIKTLDDLRANRQFKSLNYASVLQTMFGGRGDYQDAPMLDYTSPETVEKSANDNKAKKAKSKKKSVKKTPAKSVKKNVRKPLQPARGGDIVAAA
jgi:DNA-binding transcriptional regulator YdaS (Cro superfamily)